MGLQGLLDGEPHGALPADAPLSWLVAAGSSAVAAELAQEATTV